MRKRNLIILIPLICLSSCGKKNYQVEDYKKTMEYKDNFRICQLTDIHFGVEMDINYELKHLEKMINKMNNPDLIVITGDSFLDANKAMVKTFVKFFDKFNIPWTFTYGNHDLQGDYDYYYINDQIRKCKNSVFVDYMDDKISGLTNFYINLDKGNETKYRLYIVDSNTYYSGGIKYKYDIIHEDQIKHIQEINKKENDNAPSLFFFHIPLFEFQDAFDGYTEGKFNGTGTNNEKCCIGYKNEEQFKSLMDCNAKGMFVGHDHINYSSIDFKEGDYEAILAYGVKATDLVYHDNQLIGYKEITLPSDGNFKLENVKDVFVPYE